jgi:glyoxylase-like metal-dependent hydrolase (beta-lactamase superfamily II)
MTMSDAGNGAANERLYFRQLLGGRDFAQADQLARQMVNFSYLVGDRATGEAVVVDPAYAVGELLDTLAADEMRCVGVLASHYHADHVGGSIAGFSIEGIAQLLAIADVPIHVQRDEVPWVQQTTGVGNGQLVAHDGGDVIDVGGVRIELLHTPGHTPGSQCFLVQGRLVSGDTLFLDGCGRTDLPGSDPAAMYESLTTRLARIPDDTILFPGHQYSPAPSAPMGDIRRTNFVFAPRSAAQWLAMFGQ